MELNEYLAVIRRWWLLILLAILVLGGGLLSYAATRPASYEAIATVSFVKRVVPIDQRGPDFQYDNYYSLEASRLLAQMGAGWLEEPATVQTVYQRANVPLPSGLSPKRYSRLIEVDQLRQATLQVATSADTADRARQLASAATNFVELRTQELIDQGSLDQFDILQGAPVTQLKAAQTTLYTAVGVVLGTLLGLILAFVADALKPRRRA